MAKKKKDRRFQWYIIDPPSDRFQWCNHKEALSAFFSKLVGWRLPPSRGGSLIYFKTFFYVYTKCSSYECLLTYS